MSRRYGERNRAVHRRRLFVGGVALFALTTTGCISTLFRGNEKPTEVDLEEDDPKPYRLVSSVARPFGLEQYVAIGVALVTGLDNTGSDPPPSPERDMLLNAMRAKQVDHPAKVLASPETSLVTVRGMVPPAAREGDRFDVEVFVPRRSETTSLRNGWLMMTPIRPMAVLDGSPHSGNILGYVEGSIIDQAALEGSGDMAQQKHGWVLGGGKVADNRTIGLLLGQEEHWFRLVKEVTHAINLRFYTYDRGQKVGAAEAKRDTFIELQLPRRYRRNLTRFMKVTLAIPFRFETISRTDYVKQTGTELMDVPTAQEAAVRLEAIGDDAVPNLLEGLQHSEATVRFYAAEALAYLNRGDGIKTLATFAERDSDLRLRAITALAALDDMEAHDALTSLLDSESAETRYGAFRALQETNPQDPTLGRDPHARNFNFYRVATTKSPMIHVSRSSRPEIVMFGLAQQFTSTPFVVLAGKQLVLKCDVPGHISIKRFARNGTDETRDTGGDVAEVIQALGEMDASYPQVVQVLQEAKRQGVLTSRLAFDALPRGGKMESPSDMTLPEDLGDIDPSTAEEPEGEGGAIEEIETPDDPQK